MIKINILNEHNNFHWSSTYGYWLPIHYFKDSFRENNLDFNFFNRITKDFYKADYLIISNRFFLNNFSVKLSNKIKLNYNKNLLREIKKIYKINKNIIWFDLKDSAGNLQREIFPYLKKYVKNQVYRELSWYNKEFYRDRYFSDFYQNKYKIEKYDFSPNYPKLQEIELNKIHLGWNIGVGRYFDILNKSIFQKYYDILKLKINKKSLVNLNNTLKFYNFNKKNLNFFFQGNLRETTQKQSIHFCRQKIIKILTEKFNFNFQNERLNHKNFLDKLRNSKISIGAFGWGEVCYREFEAAMMGTAVFFPNISYLKTWPNIYEANNHYHPFKLDFSDFESQLILLINDENLREKLVINSQNEMKKVYSDIGFGYFLNLFKKIIC